MVMGMLYGRLPTNRGGWSATCRKIVILTTALAVLPLPSDAWTENCGEDIKKIKTDVDKQTVEKLVFEITTHTHMHARTHTCAHTHTHTLTHTVIE